MRKTALINFQNLMNVTYAYNRLYSQQGDHCRVTDKYRGSCHHICNANFWLKNKIFAIIHNLGGYCSHLIMQYIHNYNQKINVAPNNMEKSTVFMLRKNSAFIDSMQFMNPSIVKFV